MFCAGTDLTTDRNNKAESFDESSLQTKGVNAGDSATQDCVKRQLGKISPEHRTVIDLVHLRDMSQKDAAMQLGIPLGTVKSRLSRALKEAGPLLRECL